MKTDVTDASKDTMRMMMEHAQPVYLPVQSVKMKNSVKHVYLVSI